MTANLTVAEIQATVDGACAIASSAASLHDAACWVSNSTAASPFFIFSMTTECT